MNTSDLSQFYGTKNYYHTSLFNDHLQNTDGVQYFAEVAGCFWFLDIVATEVYPLTTADPFLTISLIAKDGKAQIIVQDGDVTRLMNKHIDYTDCPDGTYEFFLTDDVLMLTKEY